METRAAARASIPHPEHVCGVEFIRRGTRGGATPLDGVAGGALFTLVITARPGSAPVAREPQIIERARERTFGLFSGRDSARVGGKRGVGWEVGTCRPDGNR